MTAPTTTRSAYPATVDELLPQAIELTKTLGKLPSRNRLMTDFKIGGPKAKELLAELTKLAERDQNVTDLHTAMVRRGSTAERPALHLAPEPAADPEPAPDPAPLDPVIVVRDEGFDLFDSATAADPEPAATADPPRRPVTWPVLILCLPAFVAIWGGWVEMGRLTGFGMVKLLPGILDSVEIDTAITLPIGVETYAAFALYVWLSGRATGEALSFAKWSALASLALGAFGQVAYHLMAAAGWTSAPWPITAAVACIPVAVLGMGAALAHLMHRN